MSIQVSISQACADLLAATTFFSEIPILVQTGKLDDDGSSFEDKIGRALSCHGFYVAFKQAMVNVESKGSNGTFFVPKITIEVKRNSSSTQSIPEGSDIIENAIAALRLFVPLSSGVCMTPMDPAYTAKDDGSGFMTYTAIMRAGKNASQAISQVALPVISFSGGHVVMTSATPGAQIFYSFDGSPPSPNIGQVYVPPVSTPATGTVIACRGWLYGFLTSKIAHATVP